MKKRVDIGSQAPNMSSDQTPSHGSLAEAACSLSRIYHNANRTNDKNEDQQILVAKSFLRPLARPLLDAMEISEATVGESLQLLDLACGSGVIIQEAQEILPTDVLKSSRFLATDTSKALVELVNKRIGAEGWVNTNARVLDAMVRCQPPGPSRDVANIVCGKRILVFLEAPSVTYQSPWAFTLSPSLMLS